MKDIKNRNIKEFEISGFNGTEGVNTYIRMEDGDTIELYNFKYIDTGAYLELDDYDPMYLDMLAGLIKRYGVVIKIRFKRDKKNNITGTNIWVDDYRGSMFDCDIEGALTSDEKAAFVHDAYNMFCLSGSISLNGSPRVQKEHYTMVARSKYLFGVWPVLVAAEKLIKAVLE